MSLHPHVRRRRQPRRRISKLTEARIAKRLGQDTESGDSDGR